MLKGQDIEIDIDGNVYQGVITKVINRDACVVYWEIYKGPNKGKYNRLFTYEELFG